MSRYRYSTVGYGIFSLLGEKYRMGRIEIFDTESDSPYQISEGDYCMPYEAARKFEYFMDSLATELPIQINIGSIGWCEQECATSLGFESVEQMRDPELVKEYRRKQSDKWAVDLGYKDFEDMKSKSKWLNNKGHNPEIKDIV
jgi:hypothetical protein